VKVTVVWATSRVQDTVALELPRGASVADAVAESGLVTRHRLDLGEIEFAIFGRRARADAPVADGDRVELTRPLIVDPKVARARRAPRKPLVRTALSKKLPPAGER
jgi:uncharacterized protein